MVGRILPLARAVQRAGHEVALYTLSGNGAQPQGSTMGDHWVWVAGPNRRPDGEAIPSPLGTIRRWRAGLAGLRRALADEHPDIVVLAKPQLQNTGPALELAARTGAPLVLDADDLEAEASRLPSLLRVYASTLETRAARAAALITACSPFLVDHYRRLTADSPSAETSGDGRRPTSEVPPRVELLPTGITVPADIPPAPLRPRLGLPADARIILYVGSLSIASGHRLDLLLAAFQQLMMQNSERETHLVFAGSGLDEAWLRAHAARLQTPDPRLPTRIHFLGRFSPPEDFALAQEADLLVDPVDASRTNRAKSSHRVMLALATGKPIVAGNVGLRPFLLPPSVHGDCLYDPTDSASFTAALRRGLAPECAERFRRETEGRISQWTWETLGTRFVQLIESLKTMGPNGPNLSGN